MLHCNTFPLIIIKFILSMNRKVKYRIKQKAVQTDCLHLDSDSTEDSKALEVLTLIRQLTRQWIQSVAAKNRLPLADTYGGMVCVTGSHVLGATSDGSDLDLVCVVPRFVDREKDFFGEFVEMLKHCSLVDSLIAIKEAYVPLIKLCIKAINIDLLFARVNLERVDESLSLFNDDMLADCDAASIYSINSYRNNIKITQLFPDRQLFGLCLSTVKRWAKARGVYGNKLGYLGGVSWAIMVTKAFQLFRADTLHRAVEVFFKTFAAWKWNRPVILCDMKVLSLGNGGVHNWNPRSSENDQQHLMPIITPMYPCLNSAFNVSATTLRVMRKEFQRAKEIISQINEGAMWETLFEEYSLFNSFHRYIKIEVISGNEEESKRSEGLVESKLRLLIINFERQFGDLIRLRPYPRAFHTTSELQHTTLFFMGVRFLKDAGKKIDLRDPVESFLETMKTVAQQAGYDINLRISHAILKDIPKEVLVQARRKEPKKRLLEELRDDIGKKITKV
eukprot:TRINITY_DN5628_c0_g2_i6.p1 TRINITY_DN5628_c0_g2~~TRINITY_DN5628_c0_g2_i6.p1  ORF type:complete len:505 (-),score=110.13 TRINITY_DN5628_c0_g2_i6:148-1662(-)